MEGQQERAAELEPHDIEKVRTRETNHPDLPGTKRFWKYKTFGCKTGTVLGKPELFVLLTRSPKKRVTHSKMGK